MCSSDLERLLAGATVIWLSASPEDHLARVLAQGDTRPMARRSDAMRELRGILRVRRALYERAHQSIDTTKLGLGRSIERLVKLARTAFEREGDGVRESGRGLTAIDGAERGSTRARSRSQARVGAGS